MFTDTLYIRMFFIQLLSLVSIMAQQPSRTLSAVDAELACICGENSSPYAERIRLIHSLPSNLAPGQLERCRMFLESPLAGQPLPDLEFNALKNELVFALLRQREGLAELAELLVLVRMSRAPETDATWRDYCVQFLGKCHPAIPDEKSRAAMAAALWETLSRERSTRLAGTASRQLRELSRRLPGEFPAAEVAAASLAALRSPECCAESRAMLLQTCASLGERGALPAARECAFGGGQPLPVRMAALAAVGALGDEGDLEHLGRLAASGDLRLSRPAQAAIDRIRNATK